VLFGGALREHLCRVAELRESLLGLDERVERLAPIREVGFPLSGVRQRRFELRNPLAVPFNPIRVRRPLDGLAALRALTGVEQRFRLRDAVLGVLELGL